MDEATGTEPPPPARPNSWVRRLWRRIRAPLANSTLFKSMVARIAVAWLRLVWRTNPLVEGSADIKALVRLDNPGICAAWHGQHLVFACMKPEGIRASLLISRSADAEINAIALNLCGIDTVRGSGGKADDHRKGKGGARALIAMKHVLDRGDWTGMIADIPNGTPRESGMGVVTLARISGRHIQPFAYATSRRKVLEKTWDKMTINLPFGRGALLAGEPIRVAADAGEAEMEAARRKLTDELNRITTKAQAMADARP